MFIYYHVISLIYFNLIYLQQKKGDDYINIIIFGSEGVGKTALVNRFINGTFIGKLISDFKKNLNKAFN